MRVDPVFAQRLAAQRLAAPRFSQPRDAVGTLLAVQSQDFAPGLWALASRMENSPTRAELVEQFNAGVFVRTHVLRPTWHFVLPDDVAWLEDLTGPRVRQTMRSMWPRIGLNDEVVDRGIELIGERVAQGPASRPELKEHLAANGIELPGMPLSHIVMAAELAGLICSGPLSGKEHTYALVAHRAPGAQRREPEEALGELVSRYVTGHGPTTLRDLRFWASLPLRDLGVGLQVARDRVQAVELEGKEFLVPAGWEPARDVVVPRVQLLQAFDELVVGYSHTRARIDPQRAVEAGFPTTFEYGNAVLVDGSLAGWWRREERGKRLDVHVAVVGSVQMSKVLQAAVERECRRVARFYGLETGEVVLVRDAR